MGRFGAKEKYKKTQTSGGSGDGIRRVKLIPGTNLIRIVEDNFEDAWIHHFPDAGGKIRREVCLGKNRCPICMASKKNKANHRFYFNVIDRKEQKASGKAIVKVLEVGIKIYEAIRDLALDDEYGNPTQYNLKIERKGEGKMDTSYSVRASAKMYDLTKAEKEALSQEASEGGAYDLGIFVAKKTRAELGAILTGEEAVKEGEEAEDKSQEEDDNMEEETIKKNGKEELAEKDEEDGEEDELDIDKEIDELEEDEEEEEEEEERPKKKSKKKQAKKDEDDDGEF